VEDDGTLDSGTERVLDIAAKRRERGFFVGTGADWLRIEGSR
jgi:hypothetical protein